MKSKIFLLAVTVGLAFLVWDHFSVHQGSSPDSKPGLPPAPAALPTPRAVNEQVGRLVVGGKMFEEVVVRAVSPDSVSIRHRDGAATLPLAELPEKWRVKFGYSPEAELAYAALKKAHLEFRQKVEAFRLASASPSVPVPARMSILERCGAWGMAVYRHFFPPPAPPPLVPDTNPGFVRNRREVIAFHQRAIDELIEQESKHPIRVRSHGSGVLRTTPETESSRDTHAFGARQKQIADYQARIATLKAEIGM